MGALIVVTGPPGAGKSTVATLVAEHFERSAVVPGDHFFGFLRNGAIEPWLPHSHRQNTAVVEAAAAAAGRLARHCTVVYDGVVGPWFLSTFVEYAARDSVDYAVLLPPLEVCVDRVRTRVGHGFTDLRAAERMWGAFDRARTEARFRFADTAAPAELARGIIDAVAAGSIRFPARDNDTREART